MDKIKIGALDDHPLVLEGIKNLLINSEKFELILSETDPTVFFEKNKELNCEIVIFDVIIPNYQAVIYIKEFIEAYRETKIIIYSTLINSFLVENLFKIGINGYVNKNEKIEKLIEALETVSNSLIYLPENLAYILKKISPDRLILTEREIEILVLISQEFKSIEIGEKLFVSENTIEKHRKQLFQKLSVTNVAGLIRAGMEQGYLK